jgi:hypothetical protein
MQLNLGYNDLMMKIEGNEMKYINKYLDIMLDEGIPDSVLQVSVRDDGWAVASIVDQPTAEALLCFNGEHFMTCACSGGIAEALAMLDARVQKYCFPDTL